MLEKQQEGNTQSFHICVLLYDGNFQQTHDNLEVPDILAETRSCKFRLRDLQDSPTNSPTKPITFESKFCINKNRQLCNTNIFRLTLGSGVWSEVMQVNQVDQQNWSHIFLCCLFFTLFFCILGKHFGHYCDHRVL